MIVMRGWLDLRGFHICHDINIMMCIHKFPRMEMVVKYFL